jgi:bifunctional ADP-heptose synthase (sugar kinase/adenylyltransferase)
VEAMGGQVKTVELVDGLSTSKVIESIIEVYK